MQEGHFAVAAAVEADILKTFEDERAVNQGFEAVEELQVDAVAEEKGRDGVGGLVVV